MPAMIGSSSELSPAEIGVAYKELWWVEQAFRELKTGLEIRPVYHSTATRVRGHFGICFLALVMESALSRMLKEGKPQTSYREVLKDVEQVKAVRVELNDQAFLLRTELVGRAYEAFQALGLRPPPRLQPLAN